MKNFHQFCRPFTNFADLSPLKQTIHQHSRRPFQQDDLWAFQIIHQSLLDRKLTLQLSYPIIIHLPNFKSRWLTFWRPCYITVKIISLFKLHKLQIIYQTLLSLRQSFLIFPFFDIEHDVVLCSCIINVGKNVCWVK